VSSYYFICVLILVFVCIQPSSSQYPPTPQLYCYICVLILLYMCSHASGCVYKKITKKKTGFLKPIPPNGQLLYQIELQKIIRGWCGRVSDVVCNVSIQLIRQHTSAFVSIRQHTRQPRERRRHFELFFFRRQEVLRYTPKPECPESPYRGGVGRQTPSGGAGGVEVGEFFWAASPCVESVVMCVQLVSQFLRLKVWEVIWERSEMEVTFVLGRFTQPVKKK